jgi:hypothetical protein
MHLPLPVRREFLGNATFFPSCDNVAAELSVSRAIPGKQLLDPAMEDVATHSLDLTQVFGTLDG